MGRLTETASRIIRKYGQAATFERPAPPPANPWDHPEPGAEVTFHPAMVGIVDYDAEYHAGELIQAGDMRALVSVEGLGITPTVADWLIVGEERFAIVRVGSITVGGIIRFHDLQVRK